MTKEDKMPFGKYFGTPLKDIPFSYWEGWYYFNKDKKGSSMPPDHKEVRNYIEREIIKNG